MPRKVTSMSDWVRERREWGAMLPGGYRAMLIRRAKLKYLELSESQIARYVGCSPSNVHQVWQSFLACRPTRMRIPI